jgi:hypothetical protein
MMKDCKRGSGNGKKMKNRNFEGLKLPDLPLIA